MNCHKVVERLEQIGLCETHLAPFVPCPWEIHTALEVGDVDLRPFLERLHEQQLQ